MERFEAMLADFDQRFLSLEAASSRAMAARAVEMSWPSTAHMYDRRLVFRKVDHNVDSLARLEALTPLVRLQMQIHYPSTPASHSMLQQSLQELFSNTELLTNDAKGRMVEGYILHCIRDQVRHHRNGVTIPLLHGGAPWATPAANSRVVLRSMHFDFPNTDVVNFPGTGLPSAALLGDLSRSKFYIPMRSNYPHFDFFVYHAGQTGPGPANSPTLISRCSVTVKLRLTAPLDSDGAGGHC